MVTFADASQSFTPNPTRAPAQRRAGGIVALTCSISHPSRPLYEFNNRTHAQLVSPSRDPIGYEGSKWNLVEGLSSSPLAVVDPLGLQDSVIWGTEFTDIGVGYWPLVDGNGNELATFRLGGIYIHALGDCDDSDAIVKMPRLQQGKIVKQKHDLQSTWWACTLNSVTITLNVTKQEDTILEDYCGCHIDGSRHCFTGDYYITIDVTCKWRKQIKRIITPKLGPWPFGTLCVGPCPCPSWSPGR